MTRTLATLSLILTALFVLLILALHILRPDVKPLVSGISYYAIGRFGSMLGLAVGCVGVSGILLAVALWPATPATAGRIGLILVVLWALTSVLAGLFPLDAPGAAPTLSGRIHGLTGMNFLLIVPALLLIELGSGKGARTATYWLAWGLLGAAVLLFVFNGPLYSLQVGGAIQRLYWLVLVAWLFLKAAHARSAAGTSMA